MEGKDTYAPTNADRIRAMSDEELALWICGVYDIEEEHGKFINGIIIPGYAPHDIEEWLQQPAEEDDHSICGATNLPCIRRNPGGYDNRKEGADNEP